MEFYRSDYHALLTLLQSNRNQDDPYAVRRACHELSRFVMQRQVATLEMVRSGVLATLSSIVATFATKDAVVVIDCCRFLRRLISLKEPNALDIQSKITEAGFLPLLANALHDHREEIPLFEEVCKLLALLCFDSPCAPHADNQVAAAEAGLLQIMADRLQNGSLCESNVIAACEAIGAIIYENEQTVSEYVQKLRLLQTLANVLTQFSVSTKIIVTMCQILFQILTILPGVCTEIVELQFVERVLDFLETPLATHDMLVQWHILKFLEVVTRHEEIAKDEFCRCRGPFTVINAIQHVSSTSSINSLYYVSCILFCRLSVDDTDRPMTAGMKVPVLKRRVDHLVESGAHQYAVRIIQSVGISATHVTEQALLLLDRIASIEANRIPLTRLGASRQVKVIYNSTKHPGLLALCERAATAIDGT